MRFSPKPWLFIPSPKTFHLADGSMVTAPTLIGDTREIKAAKVEPWPGAPLEPIGDPLLAGVGPGSWNVRPEKPYQTFDGHDVVAPLRVATNFAVAADGGNPLGFTVIGVDRKVAGAIKDLWIDRAESLLRYYEIGLTGGKSALVPVHFADVDFRTRTIKINSLTAQQIELVPALKNPDRVTMQEEDRVAAFYGGGTLYSTPARAEPLL